MTLLCLIKVVCPSVVNIMAESSGNHGEGFKVRVVLLQLTGLLGKSRLTSSVAGNKKLKEQSRRVLGEESALQAAA